MVQKSLATCLATSGLETAINNAVEDRLRHFDVDVRPDLKFHGVVDENGKPNFCTLTPNYALNRVDLTLNHLHFALGYPVDARRLHTGHSRLPDRR